MAFIGLILGGIPIILKRISGKKLCGKNVTAFLVMFVFIIGLKMIGGSGSEVSLDNISFLLLVELFFVGVIAAATMVIPGVSGSMVLMLLGFYNPVLNTVTDCVSALAAFDIPVLVHNVELLIPFGIGVLIGIFAVAKLIEILIQKQESMTFSGIMGLVVASPVVVLMELDLSGGLTIMSIIAGIITFVCGFAVAYVLSEK
jgi:putative membrane protein